MADDDVTTTASEEVAEEKAEEKAPAKAPRRVRAKKPATVKVTGLVSTVYLGRGEVVHVMETPQLQGLAARGMVRIDRNG